MAAMLLVFPLSLPFKWSLRFCSDSQKLELRKSSLHNDLPSPRKAVQLVELYLYLETIYDMFWLICFSLDVLRQTRLHQQQIQNKELTELITQDNVWMDCEPADGDV